MTFFRHECRQAFPGGPIQGCSNDGTSDFLQGHIVAVAGRVRPPERLLNRMPHPSPSSPRISLPRNIDGPLAVVGDLHGAAGLLERLLRRLRETPGFETRWIVFVGDFLDRGPRSRECLEAVLGLLDGHGRVAACMGNHDLAAAGAMCLVATPSASNWNLRYVADYDAFNTFASYGVPMSEEEFDGLAASVRRIKPYYDPYDLLYAEGEVPAGLLPLRDETFRRVDALLADLRGRMPERHKDFLAGLPWCVEHPQYLLVHAGLKPDDPFAEQLEVLRARDFDDGRPPWLHEKKLAEAAVPADCPFAVVSGHTVVPEVRVLQGGRRILVDTFGGYGSVLSAVLLPELKVVTSEAGTR